MCWSADASILSFIVGCLGIVLAAFKGVSPFMILFFSTIVAMQLVEYIIWTYGIDSSVESGKAASPPKAAQGCERPLGASRQGRLGFTKCASVPTINFAASLAAASLLALQPIASILTVSQSYIPVAAYLIFAFFAHILDNDARPLQERYKMTAESRLEGCGDTCVSTPHLVWHWLTPAPIYSLLVYFFFLLTPLVISGNAVLLGVVLAALAFSIISYASAWGSVWCYAIHCIVVVLCLVK